MDYQCILGDYNQTTVAGLISRCPATRDVFKARLPKPERLGDLTLKQFAQRSEGEAGYLYRDLFDVYLQHHPLEELDTDVLLDILKKEYDASHLQQLPRVHRLARKIEALHRNNPEAPKGITQAVKTLEGALWHHIEREDQFVLKHMENDQPPRQDTPIAQMNEEHADIKGQLKKLRALTGNYRAPASACRSWRRFYEELRVLDFGLSEQIFLEREILFPRFQF
ncbi:hemerythrin domain-containing protein [Marinobacteraceae bacterium S3BR75-40.1]